MWHVLQYSRNQQAMATCILSKALAASAAHLATLWFHAPWQSDRTKGSFAWCGNSMPWICPGACNFGSVMQPMHMLTHAQRSCKQRFRPLFYALCRAAVYLEMGKYEECVKDCDEAVERGREVRTQALLLHTSANGYCSTFLELYGGCALCHADSHDACWHCESPSACLRVHLPVLQLLCPLRGNQR